MKKHKIIKLIFVIAFVGIQFIPTNRNQSDEIFEPDFMTIYAVPHEIETLIKISCYDCHSNNTKYPWYNQIQPIRAWMAKHIQKGKEELNFNEFGDYSNRRKKSKIKSMISQMEEDKMPLPSYTFVHRETKLSDNEKTEVTDWLKTVLETQ